MKLGRFHEILVRLIAFSVIACLVGLFFYDTAYNIVLGVPCFAISIILVVVAVVFTHIYGRCPHCGKPLQRWYLGKHCIHCGAWLGDE